MKNVGKRMAIIQNLVQCQPVFPSEKHFDRFCLPILIYSFDFLYVIHYWGYIFLNWFWFKLKEATTRFTPEPQYMFYVHLYYFVTF